MSDPGGRPCRGTAVRVLEAEADAIRTAAERVGESFERAVDLAAACAGKIAVTGLGKSGIICKKIAATLSSTGSPAIFLHAADALHGDVGLLSRDDLILAVSKSGETPEILQVLNVAKRLGLPVIAMAGERGSPLARYADVFLDVSVAAEACPFGLAPTTSTAVALAMGDALAIALMERKGFDREDFASVHPAGSIGKKLMRVGELMHRGESIPRVLGSTPMADVIYEMSRKSLGMTTVTDEQGVLAGVISDGDLRRLLQRSADPLKLAKMEAMKITSLVVVDARRIVVGVVHLHDLWRTEMF